jgi:hypothetical protein
VALDTALQAELQRLGTVALIVAPGLWHHLFIREYVVTYPEAQTLAASGLQEARPDVAFDGTPWTMTALWCRGDRASRGSWAHRQ